MKDKTMNGKSESLAQKQERFSMLCASLDTTGRTLQSEGIGTYQEKRLHAVLKDFYCPERACQEVRLTDGLLCGKYADLADAATRRAADRYVADILTEQGEIVEIQTGGFYPLAKKLHFYLCSTNLRVTVVHPVAAVKWMRWMDADTGELTERRRSPKKGTVRDVARELYWLLPYLAEPRFRLRIPLLEMEEVRLLDGWGNGGKRGSHRYDRTPLSLLDEVVFDCPDDYAAVFLPPPDRLPAPFTAAEYAKATGLRGRAVYAMLRMLTELGFLSVSAPRGRAGTWERR